MKVAIVNESTLIDAATARIIVQAEQHALSVFAQQWGLVHPSVSYATPAQAQAKQDAGTLIVLLDDADQAGALGYHSTTPDGKVYARVFVRDSIADLTGRKPASITGVQPQDLVLRTVAGVVDHEAKEAVLDPDAGDFTDDGNGVLWAKEACDAVESTNDPTTITLKDGSTVEVVLSDHLLPAYFTVGAPGPYDHSGVLTAGFTLAPGGYAIKMQEGRISQVFGDDISPAKRAAHEAAFAADPESAATATRTGWRKINADINPQETQMARKPKDETVEEGREPVGDHPEPTPVGHGVVQDNVTDPENPRTAHVETALGSVEERPRMAAEGHDAADADSGLHPGDERLPSDQVEPGQ